MDCKCVFVLKKSNYVWYKVNLDEFDDWMRDGSISSGDIIVYPKDIKVARVRVERKVELDEPSDYDL